jgi:5'-phosphate synthase pdxT subunit
MLKGLALDFTMRPLARYLGSGRPVFGTCAGAILLAREVTHPAQRSFGALDVAIERNAYGTQLDSFVCQAEVEDARSELAGLECVLIRAPRITRVGDSVRVHARIKGDPALVSRGLIFAATFHPELTRDARVYGSGSEARRLGLDVRSRPKRRRSAGRRRPACSARGDSGRP